MCLGSRFTTGEGNEYEHSNTERSRSVKPPTLLVRGLFIGIESVFQVGSCFPFPLLNPPSAMVPTQFLRCQMSLIKAIPSKKSNRFLKIFCCWSKPAGRRGTVLDRTSREGLIGFNGMNRMVPEGYFSRI